MSDLLTVSNLVTDIKTRRETWHVVDDVSFSVARGETFGLVGESGSGKSITCRSILRLVRPPIRVVGGEIVFEGQSIIDLPERDMRKIRGQGISMIFQDPMTALNPVLSIEQQIVETLDDNVPRNTRHQIAVELMQRVGIPSPEERLRDFPHQFSGGMRQRTMIAIALARNPRLLLADEPTTALDVTIQDQILKLLYKLQQESQMGLLLVTHDLSVVAQVCDRVGVMYAGQIVEMAVTADLYRQSRHPYTIGLMNSIPRTEQDKRRLTPIPGNIPNLANPPPGCKFHPRCPWAEPRCKQGIIPLVEISAGHFSRCIRADELTDVHEFPLVERDH